MAKLASFSVFFSYSRLVSANAVIMSASLPPEVSNSTEDNRGLNSSLLPLLDTIVCALSVCSNHSNSWRCRPGYERSIVDVIRWAIHTCMYCFKSVFKIREQFVDNCIYTEYYFNRVECVAHLYQIGRCETGMRCDSLLVQWWHSGRRFSHHLGV